MAIRFRPFPARALAVLSGLGCVLIFPDLNVWPLAFVVLVPLLWAVQREPSRNCFQLGWLAGLIYFAGSLSWLQFTLMHFGRLAAGLSLLALFLLAGYLALYPAIFSHVLAWTRRSRVPFELRVAALWVATEGLRGYLLTGFPWNLLGYSLHSNLEFIQIADLGGAYGVSFFLALTSAFAYRALAGPGGRDRIRGAAGFVVLVLLGWGYGSYRLSEPMPQSTLRVGVVQHNPPQEYKWNEAFRESIVNSLFQLSERTLPQQPDLLVWPEAALPFRFRYEIEERKRLSEFAGRIGRPILFGSTDKDPDAKRYYNAAFLLDEAGEVAGTYRKTHLVPFGEYVPLQTLLFFLEKLADVGGNFYPGGSYEVFTVGKTQLSVVICFESAFGEIVRQFAQAGAQVLVTITNDSWFGRTDGTTQHLAFAPFRAVETRRPVVQAAQSGYSAAYDRNGRLLARTHLLRPEQVVIEVHPAEVGTTTLYLLLGNWVVYACWLLGLGLLLERRYGQETPK